MRTKLFEPMMPAEVTSRVPPATLPSRLPATPLIPNYQPPAKRDAAESRLPSGPPATRTRRGLPAFDPALPRVVIPMECSRFAGAQSVAIFRLNRISGEAFFKCTALPPETNEAASRPETYDLDKLPFNRVRCHYCHGPSGPVWCDVCCKYLCSSGISSDGKYFSCPCGNYAPLHHTLRTVQGTGGALTSSRAGRSPVGTSGEFGSALPSSSTRLLPGGRK